MRPRLRKVLLLAGVVPAVLAVVLAVLVTRMLTSQGAGEESFDSGDFADAAASFDSAGGVNPFEEWVTAFDRGAAEHADGDLDAAIELYESALTTVPTAEECTVRINLALAHESVGDGLVEDEDADEQDVEDAIASWDAGLTALRDGDCPEDSGRGEAQTEDAAAVEERLEKKIEQQQQQQQQKKKKDDQKENDEDQKKKQERERKERELEKQNERAEKQKQRYERQKESGGYQPEW
ncbi:hypothetical protein [Nocardioides sambongensis]|uniref:hypothetical protein n=1 Tax=Nocardioides sambongensis TaxID=2589074 RepID=UPI00112C0B52|nr:hypothetical protein [Nocardioides sambongensis]